MPQPSAQARAARPTAVVHALAADAAALLRLVERAAADPDVDLDRLERLAALHERARTRQAEAKFSGALARLQQKLPILIERGEITGPDGERQATYATWEDTLEAIRPLLAYNGFSLSFRPVPSSAGGLVSVVGILRHRAGHAEEAELQLPADATGGKNAVQAIGSTVTYAQRYLTRMLLGLASRGEDDDAGSAGKTPAEHDAIVEINALQGKPAFLAWKRANRARLAELSGPAFQRVIGHYGARLRRFEAPGARADDA